MATPVLVREYHSDARSLPLNPLMASGGKKSVQALPPISSYAFADILRAADSPDFQHAIDGIAEICAKTRMSLADEYASHLPPLGEITAASSAATRPHLLRPGMRRALTSVPEASSGSSEGSRKSKKRSKTSALFGFRRKEEAKIQPMRSMRIGSMGRTISVSGTTAMASDLDFQQPLSQSVQASGDNGKARVRPPPPRRTSEAASSLQQLLARMQRAESPMD